MTSYYGFTIKCIKAQYQAKLEDLTEIMHRLISRHHAIYVEHFVEYDTLERPHIHGTFMARKGILLSLFKVPYHTVHVDYLPSIHDVENWANYIRADQDGYKSWLKELQDGQYKFI